MPSPPTSSSHRRSLFARGDLSGSVCSPNRQDELQLLLSQCECQQDVDDVDSQGQTTLHIAAKYGPLSSLQLLWDRYKTLHCNLKQILSHKTKKSGWTVFDMAVQSRQPDLAETVVGYYKEVFGQVAFLFERVNRATKPQERDFGKAMLDKFLFEIPIRRAQQQQQQQQVTRSNSSESSPKLETKMPPRKGKKARGIDMPEKYEFDFANQEDPAKEFISKRQRYELYGITPKDDNNNNNQSRKSHNHNHNNNISHDNNNNKRQKHDNESQDPFLFPKGKLHMAAWNGKVDKVSELLALCQTKEQVDDANDAGVTAFMAACVMANKTARTKRAAVLRLIWNRYKSLAGCNKNLQQQVLLTTTENNCTLFHHSLYGHGEKLAKMVLSFYKEAFHNDLAFLQDELKQNAGLTDRERQFGKDILQRYRHCSVAAPKRDNNHPNMRTHAEEKEHASVVVATEIKREKSDSKKKPRKRIAVPSVVARNSDVVGPPAPKKKKRDQSSEPLVPPEVTHSWNGTRSTNDTEQHTADHVTRPEQVPSSKNHPPPPQQQNLTRPLETTNDKAYPTIVKTEPTKDNSDGGKTPKSPVREDDDDQRMAEKTSPVSTASNTSRVEWVDTVPIPSSIATDGNCRLEGQPKDDQSVHAKPNVTGRDDDDMGRLGIHRGLCTIITTALSLAEPLLQNSTTTQKDSRKMDAAKGAVLSSLDMIANMVTSMSSAAATTTGGPNRPSSGVDVAKLSQMLASAQSIAKPMQESISKGTTPEEHLENAIFTSLCAFLKNMEKLVTAAV